MADKCEINHTRDTCCVFPPIYYSDQTSTKTCQQAKKLAPHCVVIVTDTRRDTLETTKTTVNTEAQHFTKSQ